MQISFFRAALPLVLACLMGATATATASSHPCGSIVYTQALRGSDGSLLGSGLSLALPANGTSKALTPTLDGVIDDSASWSPDGTRVAFEHRPATTQLAQHSDILIFDTRSHEMRKATMGRGDLTKPAWGRSDRIAYVSQYRRSACLSVIEPGGRQHDLYCPPSPAQLMTPVWSKDGRNLYVQAGYSLGGLDNFWRSVAYRIDATTGAPFVLDDRVFDGPQHLEFAPGGRRGIYANAAPYSADMLMVDFATGSSHSVGTGYAPRWSKDGRRIAYTGEVYELTNPVRYYEPLYVMQANGSDPRRVTRTRVNNEAYTAADWSRDGVHLLVNRRIYLDPSLTIPQYDLRIVNMDSGAQTRLPVAGYANPGAWFEN